MKRDLYRPVLALVGLLLALFPKHAEAVDNFVNMGETAHVSVGNCGYIWGWYDPDSSNYFVFTSNWNSPSGVTVVKATDPNNPVVVQTRTMPWTQDIKVVGDHLYATDWIYRGDDPRFLWIMPLKSQWPYYDASSVDSIPFNDNAVVDTPGWYNQVPLFAPHTIFATTDYLFITELRTIDAGLWEVAVYDIATNPQKPRLIKLWNYSDFAPGLWPHEPFQGHSVFCKEDTVYMWSWHDGIYKGIIDPVTPVDSITLLGKITYDSFRDDLNDEFPGDSIYCFTDTTIGWRLKKPIAHSGWLSPNGDYLFACDEAEPEGECSSWGSLMGAFLRVFDDNSFDFDSISAPIQNAFDVIWNYSSEEDEAHFGIDDIAAEGETHCPTSFNDTCFLFPYITEQLSIHDAIPRGNLLFSSWHYRGTRVTDISDMPNLYEYGFADHDCGPSDDWQIEAYSMYPLSPDGFIYQGGVDGLYIYQLGTTGTLSSSATWHGDNYIYNTLTVSSGQTLTLAAGAHIYFHKDALLKVEGTLVASGTSSDSVKFICLGGNPQPGDWQGIYVNDNAACSLSYCSITNAVNGVEVRNYADLVVDHCNISNNSSTGIYCFKSDLNLQHSRVTNNGIYGVYGYSAGAYIYASKFIDNDAYEIYLGGEAVSGDSTLLLYDTLTTVSNPWGYGIYLGADKAEIYKCFVDRHQQYALTLYNSNAYVHNSVFSCHLTLGGLVGIYADNYSYPKIRYCSLDSLIICVKTNSSRPNMGTEDDKGKSSLSLNSSVTPGSTYYIYHSYRAFIPDTFYAQHNYYDTLTPNPQKFYHAYPTSPIKYWPWLTQPPPPPKMEGEPEIPFVFAVKQNFPNPFNPVTTISFSLDQPGFTRLTVYNILGQRLTTLLAGEMAAGEHVVIWHGRTEAGEPVSSGVYFYAIQTAEHFETKKMTLLR